MIDTGRIVLLCSRDTYDHLPNKRIHYGGGFAWHLKQEKISIKGFWLTREIPEILRVHLFGDTPEQKIGCVVIECDTPTHLLKLRRYTLHRSVLDIEYKNVLEYSKDVEYYDDSVLE